MRDKRPVQTALKAGRANCSNTQPAAHALHRRRPMEPRAVTLKTLLLAVTAAAALLGAAIVGVPPLDESVGILLQFGSPAD